MIGLFRCCRIAASVVAAVVIVVIISDASRDL
jgi:hypothetical protein